MPYSLNQPDKLPAAIKGKPKAIQGVFVEAFNEALKKGRTEEEAFIAAYSAVRNAEGKKPAAKANVTFKTPPSHVAAILQQQVQKAQDKPSLSPNPQNYGIRKEFLGKNALPVGVERNLINANFDTNSRLVLLFDTGETITTDSVKQVIENYVTVGAVLGSSNVTDPVSPANIKHFDMQLSGTSVIIPFHDHKINEIIAMYFTKNGSMVNVGWQYDSSKNIVIETGVDLTGVLLVAHGK